MVFAGMSGPKEGSAELAIGCRGDMGRLGRAIGRVLQPGDLMVLEGDLGAGKTFLVRGIARGLGVPTSVRITSPTFDLVHELPGRLPLVHVDLYRLGDPESVHELGLLEQQAQGAAVLVEWGDRFAEELGGEGLWVRLTVTGESSRVCQLSARGAAGMDLLGRVLAAAPRS